MASPNIIVTKTVNTTTFDVDNGSYRKVVKKIRQVGKEWEKASNAVAKPKNDPAKIYDKSAQQMRMVNKRLAETRLREEKRASAISIANAKKEAKAKEAITKMSAARMKQHIKGMTSATPGMAEMRKFYREQEKAAKAANRGMSGMGGSSSKPMNVRGIIGPAERGGFGTGMVGDPNKIMNPDLIRAQNQQMARHQKLTARKEAQQKKVSDRQAAAAALKSARMDDVISQQRIRLSSKYGNRYSSVLGRNSEGAGIQDLNRQFKAGVLTSGQYRQSIQALERQFRSAQNSAVGFGGVLDSVRSSMVGLTASYGAFSAGRSVLEQGQFFQGMDATMTMVSDSSEEAAKRIQFLKDQSYQLGLDLKIASQGYTQMAVNSAGILSKSENDELFKGFSEFATALQVDPVKYQRGITAIGQMMGKGQIMAEELKGQLAEGIPGSLQVFVKATQEAFNDTSIDVAKLMDMMKDGELKSAKVLPFVAKYFAEAARKGGALSKAMNSNRVAMQQLQQTWVNFQNAIFEGGFGDQMTKIFRDLATILNSNGSLATTIGNFFGNVAEGAWDMVLGVHDAFVFLDRIMSYYATQLGYKGDVMKEIFDWGAYVLGMMIFFKGLSKILSILTKIVGLRKGLKGVRDALGGDLVESVTGDRNPSTSKYGKFGALLGGPVGWATAIGSTTGDYAWDKIMSASDSMYGDATVGGGNYKADSPLGKLYSWYAGLPSLAPNPDFAKPAEKTGWVSSYSNPGYVAPQPTVDTSPRFDPTAGNALMTPPPWVGKPLDVNVNVKVQDGQVKDLIRSEIEDNETRAFNMITGGSM